MTYVCTICISDLNSNVSVALPCGHIFHKTCIEAWLTNDANQGHRTNCPLCKRPATKRSLLGPLFFSVDDNVEMEAFSSVEDKLKIEELETKNRELQSSLDKQKQDIDRKTHMLNQIQEEFDKTRATEQKYVSTVRYLKQLKRVADIDDYLSQPTTQAYLAALSRLPRPDLIVALGGLKSKCVQLANQRDVALKKAEKAKSKEEELSEKVTGLLKKVEKLKNKDKNKSKTFNPTNYLKYSESSSSRNVIVLDSDDDSDSEFESIRPSQNNLLIDNNDLDEERIPSSSSDESDDNLLYTVTDHSGIPISLGRPTGSTDEGAAHHSYGKRRGEDIIEPARKQSRA
ncbi:hypothetical protein G6F46_012354 [Rhizopus delemar]|uniref:RING-type domain-containing protein n=2 Tax=Rhizopus TaxID=4842 RepID=A0A9P6YY03_9FUNG|nr:hypothetical protein G6F55_012135 [Rhizopus delemar]KAG1533748.1 hypothetical protein G6F51_012459 [Rhizopus arrhizus]KAG1488108.1 hypothetical protein G6F54_012258 [Rhizopus delemar]KAG1495779.1 hypothetical protein G6F53_012307 [Rhizopus delemar]KAG1508639.1 hypothetical protein G6F52_011339 [Rhizopus delemar]